MSGMPQSGSRCGGVGVGSTLPCRMASPAAFRPPRGANTGGCAGLPIAGGVSNDNVLPFTPPPHTQSHQLFINTS